MHKLKQILLIIISITFLFPSLCFAQISTEIFSVDLSNQVLNDGITPNPFYLSDTISEIRDFFMQGQYLFINIYYNLRCFIDPVTVVTNASAIIKFVSLSPAIAAGNTGTTTALPTVIQPTANETSTSIDHTVHSPFPQIPNNMIMPWNTWYS